MLNGKVWGSTQALLVTPFVELHRIKIKPLAHCSLHTHNYKWNAFYVVSGRLKIEVQKNNYALTDVTELGPGEICTVKPGEYHRFITEAEEAEVLEIYYPEPLSEDIVRKTVGGLSPNA